MKPHRNLNKACYSYSKELRLIQAKIWVYSIMAHVDQCSSLGRGLCLCPSPSKDHSPHCSCKNPVSKWTLSHGSHDKPSLTESQILTFNILQSSSWSVPVASLSHPFPFPTPSTHSALVTLGLSAAQSQVTPGIFLGAFAQGLLITEHFPGPHYPPLSPAISFFTTLIMTWYRTFSCLYCVLPS